MGEEEDAGEACALVGHDDGLIQLLDIATGAEKLKLDGHKDYISCMQAHWATNEAVSTSGDGAVFYWNLQTGAGTEMPPPEGHPRSSIRTLACDWAGKRAITGNDDGYFVMWDLEEQIGQRTLNCKVGMILSLYPDWNKMRILVGHGDAWQDSDLDLLSMNDGARIKAYPIKHSLVTALDVSWSKARALVGFDGGSLQIWGLPMAASQSSLRGHKGSITAISVQWKLKRAFSGSADKSIRLWNLARVECIRLISGHLQGVRSLCIDWELGVALSSAWDGVMQIWEIADEVDEDFALQPVGGEVRIGGVALLTVKEGAEAENSEEEPEEIEADALKGKQRPA